MSDFEDNKKHIRLWGPLTILGLIILLAFLGINFDTFDSVRLNQSYATFLDSFWRFVLILFALCILFGIFIISILIKTGKLRHFKLEAALSKIWLPIVIAILLYFVLIRGVPMTVPLIENPEKVRIETTVLEKELDSSRNAKRGLTCRYKLYFEFEDIPGKSYVCVEMNQWQTLRVGDTIIINADRSSLGYKLKEIIDG